MLTLPPHWVLQWYDPAGTKRQMLSNRPARAQVTDADMPAAHQAAARHLDQVMRRRRQRQHDGEPDRAAACRNTSGCSR